MEIWYKELNTHLEDNRKLSTEEPHPGKNELMKVVGSSSGVDVTMKIRNDELDGRHYPNTIR